MLDQVRRWEEQFLVMEGEWKKIHQKQVTHLVAEWRQTMTKMRRGYQELVSRGLWVSGPSDFLSIIERAEDERTHSRMLAWLLTPTGRHGLRNLLLSRLLEHCDSKHSDAEMAQVQPASTADCLYSVDCPCWRNGREADIVAWGKDFTLVVEMKVNAGEQPAQCNDLYENFKGEPGARFLFLARKNVIPETATTPDAQRAFKKISWPEVRHMIEDALNDPVSKQGAAVPIVENYILTLKEHLDEADRG